jgi:NADH-quinone oxidoreductase subunit G
VGALTTSDFRFGARPWEMKPRPSICTKCAVGCNITYDIRREAHTNGKIVVKRVMPRQNEEVNEIWMCDKGRFTYAFNETRERIMTPLVRKNGGLTPVSWEEALNLAADKLKAAGKNVYSVVGGHLSLEDLYSMKALYAHIHGNISLYTNMGGGEWVTRVGMNPGSDLGKLEKGSTILVIGSDLHEEGPIWWLRVKAAAECGVKLVVANARKTRLDKFATHCLTYQYGEEEKALRELFEGSSEVTKCITGAENLVVFYGGDGMGVAQTTALAANIAEGLVKTQHFGRPNNGMIATWERANTQGAFELGLLPDANLVENMGAAMGLYIAGADPADDSPVLRNAIQKAGFVIVQDFFLTETAKLADIIFPAQASMEREGTLVSGERRVQKFGAAIPVTRDTHPDYAITAALLEKLGGEKLPAKASEIFDLLARNEAVLQAMNYEKLGETHPQWPLVGRSEVYYGGTGYENSFGLGIILPLATGDTALLHKSRMPEPVKPGRSQWLAAPVTKLYDQQASTKLSLLKNRISKEAVSLHPDDAAGLKVENSATVLVKFEGGEYQANVKVNADQPKGTLLVTRFSGLPIWQPTAVDLIVKPVEAPTPERGTL